MSDQSDQAAATTEIPASPDAAGTPTSLEEAVRAHAAVRLARFKQPTRIEVVDALPLTGTGRVQKGRLRGIERRRLDGLLE